MIWADRLAIVCAAFITFLFVILFLLSGDPEDFLGYILSFEYAKLLITLVLLPWLFLRFCVLVLHGARRS